MRGTPRIVGGSGGSGPFTGITGTPTEIAYFDLAGNGYSDALATRDPLTNETYIGYETGAGQFSNGLKLGNFIGGFITDGVGFQRYDSVNDNYTVSMAIDGTAIGSTSNELLTGYIDTTNGIFASTSYDDIGANVNYDNSVLGVNSQVTVNDTNATIQYEDADHNARTQYESNRIQSRYEDATSNVITKVILDTNGVELNYQDGIGSNHLYVYDDSIRVSTLQDVRDDTGSFTPINFLYTDGVGKFLSAPLSAITPNYHFYHENYVAGLDSNATGINSTAIGFGAVSGGQNSVAIAGNVGAGSDYSVAINGTVAPGCTSSLAIFGAANASSAIAIGGNSSGIASASFGGSGAVAVGPASLALATNGSSLAYGTQSIVLGNNVTSYSFSETVIGKGNTTYTPISATAWEGADRLFVVGASNIDPGSGTNYDAFTILKNRKVGVGYDNFENTVSDAKLQVNGYIGQSYGFIDATTTLTTSTIKAINKINDSTGNIDITLPDPALLFSNNITPRFTFKCVSGSSNTIRLLPFSTETIDGASSFTFTNVANRQSVDVFTDGTNWWLI